MRVSRCLLSRSRFRGVTGSRLGGKACGAHAVELVINVWILHFSTNPVKAATMSSATFVAARGPLAWALEWGTAVTYPSRTRHRACLHRTTRVMGLQPAEDGCTTYCRVVLVLLLPSTERETNL